MSSLTRKLYMDENPVHFYKTLAVHAGLNKAIVIQTILGLCQHPKCGVEIDGDKWIYNTYEGWHVQFFPFWSLAKVKMVFQEMESKGQIQSFTQNKDNGSPLKYYRIPQGFLSKLNAGNFDVNAVVELDKTDQLPDFTLGLNLAEASAKKLPRSNTIGHSINHSTPIGPQGGIVESEPEEKPEPERIYDAYPRKIGRGKALAAIQKALRSVSFDVLSERVGAFALAVSTWPQDRKQFVPFPATWFNQERWTDDPKEWENKGGVEVDWHKKRDELIDRRLGIGWSVVGNPQETERRNALRKSLTEEIQRIEKRLGVSK